MNLHKVWNIVVKYTGNCKYTSCIKWCDWLSTKRRLKGDQFWPKSLQRRLWSPLGDLLFDPVYWYIGNKKLQWFVKYLWGYFFQEYPNYAFSHTHKIHTAQPLGQHNSHCALQSRAHTGNRIFATEICSTWDYFKCKLCWHRKIETLQLCTYWSDAEYLL